MRDYLFPLLQLQRFFLPALFVILAWAIWRTIWRKDMAVGLALYVGLVIIVDSFYNTGIYLPGLEQGSIRYSEVCAVFLLISRPPPPERLCHCRTVRYFITFYFLLLFLSTMRSDPMLAGIMEFRGRIFPQIVAFLVAMRGLRSLEEYHRFVLWLIALVIFIGLFVFWDVFFDLWILYSDTLLTPEYWVARKQGRFGGLFLNPNNLAAFIVLVFPIAVIFTVNEKQQWLRLYGWTGLLMLVFCLLQTQTRAALLAHFVIILLLIFGPCGSISKKRRFGFLALFIIVFATFMPGFYQHATKRFSSLDQEMQTEGRTRNTIWHYSIRIIRDHPIIGIGFGEQKFLKTMYAYNYVEEYDTKPLDNPHNSFLQMAVYAGIPALATFLLASGALLSGAARVLIQGTRAKKIPMVFGLTLGFIGLLVCSFTDPILFTRNVAPVYWVFFGLLLSLLTRADEAKKNENCHSYLGKSS